MPKTRLMSLAAMLTLALAVMPAVAQAAPHYYKNAVLIPEGEKVPILEWGKLSHPTEPMTTTTTCEYLAGGYIENPAGGGAGIGATLRLVTYNCTNLECPAGEIEIGGKRYEKEFELIYPPQSFPWPSVLKEPEPAVVRTNSTGVVMKAACMAHKLTRSAAGEGGPTGAGEDEQYRLAAAVTCVTDAANGYEQKPQNEKGSNQGPGQSKLVFNGGAGFLGCEGGSFGLRTHESLKVMGFKGSELITVH
jgi:hypothetical protein